MEKMFNGETEYFSDSDGYITPPEEEPEEPIEDESIILLKKYLDEQDNIKERETRIHQPLLSFLQSISFYFTAGMANFSNGIVKRNSNEVGTEFTVISYNHLPANILLNDYFLEGVRTSLNRTKSDEHTNQLASVNYEKSILDSTPFIFAIMKQDLGKSLRKNIVDKHLINIGTYDLGHQFVIYGLDGQHRMSALYALDDKSCLSNKYVDLKFYLITSEEEYYTAYIALNSNLPQKNEFEKILQKQNLEFLTLKNKINQYCDDNYKKNTCKKSKSQMIRDDSKTDTPSPPCIHISALKKSTKFCQMLQKYGVDKMFDKIMKLNQAYSRKEFSSFGYNKKRKTNTWFDKAKQYEFYLGMFYNNPTRFVDDL